ncbi:MAG: hypoxanthine phosphoribosyltransferase [Calditrichia bacterium]|nr:hypoxanthine phosphoribosyltransferase [Calditrichia bacterium]
MSLIKINQQGLLGENYSVLISEEEINQRMVELGDEIVNTFSGEIPILIGVLNGGFIFLADLIRYINIDCEIDFIRISSYGDEKESSGHVKVLKPLSADIKGRHVVVVEDIVDSGLSVQFLLKMLSAFEPASLRVATLLRKKSRMKVDIPIEFIGFDIEDKYVVGYGLDDRQIKRNLRAIYIVDNDRD